MDFVISWVDNHDAKWQEEFAKYKGVQETGTHLARFRDWKNLKYWFRGVEKFAPWVDNIHFVTYGHLPNWLNTNHPKLNLVHHEDYIPKKYLPTFNSRTIELNFHHIKELANEYVYFNDDMFLVAPVDTENFFKDKQPCDMAILNALGGTNTYNFTFLSNILALNRHFEKDKSYKQNKSNWVNLKYGKLSLLNLFLLSFKKKYFTGFESFHLPQPLKKQTLALLWEKEYDLLDQSCGYTFRDEVSVNKDLQRYWELASNNFHPVNLTKFGEKFEFRSEISKEAIQTIKQQKKSIVCLNDYETFSDKNFKKAKKEIHLAFEAILPEKSNFEI